MPVQIFGRDDELEAVRRFVDGLLHSPGALVLAGAAGAGKTTLLRSGTAIAAERGFAVLRTSPAQSDFRLAFAGLADLLGPHLDTVLAELPPPQARPLRIALLLAEEPDYRPEPRLIAVAFLTALTVLARTKPVLIVVDDIQWLDPPS
jgi:hypothetical protein